MLRLCNNFIPSLSGGPFYTSVFRCLWWHGFQFFSVGSSSLNLQIMISNHIFLQTSFMRGKQGVFMAPAFLNSLCTQWFKWIMPVMFAPRTGLTKRFVSNFKKLYIGLENLVWYMCSDYYSQTCNVVLMCSVYPRYVFAFDVCFWSGGWIKSLNIYINICRRSGIFKWNSNFGGKIALNMLWESSDIRQQNFCKSLRVQNFHRSI